MIKCKNDKEKYYIMVALCFLISCILQNIPFLFPWSIDTSFCLVFFMLFGMKVSTCNIDKRLREKHTVLWLVLLGVYIILVNDAGDINISIRQYGSYGAVNILMYIILGLLGSLIYSKAAICLENTLIGRLFSTIGANTLSMLVFQFLIFYLCDYIIEYFNVEIVNSYPFIYAVIKITIAIGLSITFDIFKKFANRIRKRYKTVM